MEWLLPPGSGGSGLHAASACAASQRFRFSTPPFPHFFSPFSSLVHSPYRCDGCTRGVPFAITSGLSVFYFRYFFFFGSRGLDRGHTTTPELSMGISSGGEEQEKCRALFVMFHLRGRSFVFSRSLVRFEFFASRFGFFSAARCPVHGPAADAAVTATDADRWNQALVTIIEIITPAHPINILQWPAGQGRYRAVWPCYVRSENPRSLSRSRVRAGSLVFASSRRTVRDDGWIPKREIYILREKIIEISRFPGSF